MMKITKGDRKEFAEEILKDWYTNEGIEGKGQTTIWDILPKEDFDSEEIEKYETLSKEEYNFKVDEIEDEEDNKVNVILYYKNGEYVVSYEEEEEEETDPYKIYGVREEDFR